MAASRRTDWPTLGLLLAMYLVLIGNFAWHRLAPMPLLVHVVIAAGAIHLAFAIWYEAVHRNVSHRTWVNHAVGVLGCFVLLDSPRARLGLETSNQRVIAKKPGG